MNIDRGIATLFRGSLHQKIVLILCLAIIIISVFRFVTKGITPSINEIGYDYYQHYVAGQLWNENLNPYDYSLFRSRLFEVGQERATTFDMGYLYPPYLIYIVSNLSHLSFDEAYNIQLIISIFAIIGGMILLGVVLSWFRRIGLLELTLLAALLNTVASRDGLRAAQISPLIFLSLMLAFVMARNQSQIISGFGLFVASFKPTFVPLYPLYYLIRRQWKLVIVFVACISLFTLIPLIATQRSPVEYITDWIQTLKSGNTDVNDPSPFNFISAWSMNLQILIYRVLNSDSTLATFVNWIILAVLYGLVLYYTWRMRHVQSDDAYVLDFALLSSLSLALVYHRQYDSFLMFPGIIYLFVYVLRLRNSNLKWIAGLFLLFIIGVLTLPGDTLIGVIAHNVELNNNYLIRVILPFEGWANVAILGVLFRLKHLQVSKAIIPSQTVFESLSAAK